MPFLSNTILAEAFCSGVRLDIFSYCFRSVFPFLSVSAGVGREASKAQRVRRVRPQDALLYGFFFCACSFVFAVPFRTAGGRGYLAPSVELGKLEVCQRPPDSVPVRPGPVRGLSRPLGQYMIRSYTSFMFLRLHLLSQPVCAVWNRSGGGSTDDG